MYLDALLLVADGQTVAGADSDVSTSSIDVANQGGAVPEMGTGEPMGFGVAIDTAAEVGSGETYTFEIISATTADLGTGKVVIASFLFTAAQLLAGALSFLPLPPGKPAGRYLGLQVTKTGAGSTVKYTAWLTTQSLFSLRAKAYPKGYAV